MQLQDTGDSAVGFVTTRQVRATSPSEAQSRALAEVTAEWSSGTYASMNNGSAPSLSAEAVWPVSLWRALLLRAPGGYTFYSAL
jgi:hypothetical protein